MSADAAIAVCEYVVKQIVDHPDEVSLSTRDNNGALRIDVTVADGDMGRVIGRRGRIAGAIRTVVRAAGIDEDVPAVEVEFVD